MTRIYDPFNDDGVTIIPPDANAASGKQGVQAPSAEYLLRPD